MFNSRKKIALNLLRNQLEALDVLERKDSFTWLAQTMDIIRNYIDPKSELLTKYSKLFNNISMYRTNADKQKAFERSRTLAYGIIKTCVTRIEISGTCKPEKSNFISRMSEGWAIFFSGTVIVGVASFSYFLGGKLETITVLNENKELLKNKIILTDSINILKRSLLGRPLPNKDSKIKHPVK